MFVKTVSASEFRENLKDNLELVKGSDVLQVLHRGDGVKVILAQEYYFNILQKAKMFEEMENTAFGNQKLQKNLISKDELLSTLKKQKTKSKIAS